MKPQLVERELTVEGPSRRAPRRGGRSATVNLAESPLTWLHARGHVSDRECAAGELLRRDYEGAALAPRVTMRWSPVPGPAGGVTDHPTERRLAARARFDGALAAAGAGLADVLWRVVCDGQALGEAERVLGWPTRSGKLVLRFALQRVADFYRLPAGR